MNTQNNLHVQNNQLNMLDTLLRLENNLTKLNQNILTQEKKLKNMHQQKNKLEISIDNIVLDLHNNGLDLDKYTSKFETQETEDTNSLTLSKTDLYSLIENVIANTLSGKPKEQNVSLSSIESMSSKLQNSVTKQKEKEKEEKHETTNSWLFPSKQTPILRSTDLFDDTQSESSTAYVFQPLSVDNNKSMTSPTSCPTPTLSIRK